MPTPNYILDPRFELQMVAVHLDDQPPEIIDGPDFPAFLAGLDPALTTTVSYNALFDNSILAWRYNWVPKLMLDPMGMARALLGHELRDVSLRTVAEYLKLGHKGHAIENVMGMRREQIIAAGLWPSFCGYALQDNFLCEQIFIRLLPDFPKGERELMDMVLRCTIEPRFRCDVPMLEKHLEDVEAAKQALLEAANNVDPTTIMSTLRFKQALEELGVEVEMKLSPTTGEPLPAFAKTDEFMEKLQEHLDPAVAALATARLGFKSTIEETRTRKLLSIAKLDWPAHLAGCMPMPLRYAGAHTGRLSGEWKMNVQNMPRVSGSKGKSKLRKSLVVPSDETIITCDLSQIEARLVAWICGCKKLVDEFADNKDPYSLLASVIFGRPINRRLPGMEIEGFIGKTGILGLGYGCGKNNFNNMVLRSARAMGLDISGKYTREIGDKAVDAYRGRYREIPQGWRVLDEMIATEWLSASGDGVQFGPGGVVTIANGAVHLPNKMKLNYASPKVEMGDDGSTEYFYRYGKSWHKIYGAKLLENIVQALARIVVMHAALRIKKRGLAAVNYVDYRFRLQAHDELVFIVKRNHAAEAKRVILEEMTRRPSWAPYAPISAELGEGATYGDAK